MCHSVTCNQLIRQADMSYTANCSMVCATSCVNASQISCSVKCCNSSDCLNGTFASMMMGTTTGEKKITHTSSMLYDSRSYLFYHPKCVRTVFHVFVFTYKLGLQYFDI